MENGLPGVLSAALLTVPLFPKVVPTVELVLNRVKPPELILKYLPSG